jgi:hypothetical protein
MRIVKTSNYSHYDVIDALARRNPMNSLEDPRIAAVRDNGGGTVITTEMEPGKIARAGVGQEIELREGDARKTLQGIERPIDMLFLEFSIVVWLAGKVTP